MKTALLPYLETFAKAAELGSFTAAGRWLGTSQAAVSQRIQALEKMLAAPLFQRQGGRILLTDAGHCLYGYAERILALHQEARQKITGKKEKQVAELALAASSIPGEYLLPDLLARFRRRHPHVRLRVDISDSATVRAQVEHGRAPLGLVGKKSASAALEFRCFARDRMALVVPADHPWARRQQVSLKQLLEQPLILREAGSGSRECLEQALTAAGKSVADLQVTLELGSNEAIKQMVLRGLGLAILSTKAVAKEIKTGKLHAVRVAGLPMKRDMFVVWDRRRAQSLPAQLFVEFLTES
jgi:DNA-binding transcriptional LysR family regulator